MRYFYLIIMVVTFNVAFAIDEMASWKSQQKALMQQEMEEFAQYKQSIDAEFKSFLASQWQEMEVFRGAVRDKAPKPVVIPRVKKEPSSPAPIVQLTPIVEPSKPPVKTYPPAIVKNLEPTTLVNQEPHKEIDKSIISPPTQSLMITLLGLDYSIKYDRHLLIQYTGKPQSKSISNYWSAVSAGSHVPLITQLQMIVEQQQLNDWGHLMLIREIANGLHPESHNSRELLSWYLLIKSGYQSRVGFNGEQILLFLPSKQNIFEQGYLNIDNRKYYVYFLPDGVSLDGIYTYDGDYPARLNTFSFAMSSAPLTSQHLLYREIAFSYAGVQRNLSIPIDSHLVDYYNGYPQLDIEWYFNAPIDGTTRQALLDELRPIIEDMSNIDAVNLLLSLVQGAFPYQTDDEQFGSENYLQLEETLFYPYSDCEDRSILFSWLVSNLINIDVIGLSYPGHVATAVKMSGASGDTVYYNNESYMIADPTYIGARVGVSMPQFSQVQPHIIEMTR